MTDTRNNNDKIEKFELPRLDWHDQKSVDKPTGEIIGRIYKDALIENFNAIEDKCNEIQELDVFDIAIPEPSGVVYPDVTLDSDLSSVVNLDSLVKICGLNTYPIDIQFSGTTCTLLRYYRGINISAGHTEAAIVELKDIKTGASTSKPYIFLNADTNTIIVRDRPYNDSNDYFIGMYTGGKVIHQRSPLYPSSSVIKGS